MSLEKTICLDNLTPEVLEKAFNTEATDLGLKYRYAYYCGQSYRDAHLTEKSIEWFKIYLDLPADDQYKYCACDNLGDNYKKLNNMEEALNYWYKAIPFDRERRETVVKIMEYYFNKGNHFAINMLYEKMKNYKLTNPNSKIFLDMTSYHDIDYYNSIASCYIREWMSGYYSCKNLLLNNKRIEITLQNFTCYGYNVRLDQDNKPFLDKLLELFEKYFDSKKELVKKLWNMVSKHIKEYLPEQFETLNDKYNDLNTEKVYIIANNKIGGSYKYLTDIMNTYKNKSYIFISNKETLYNINFRKNDILILNNFLYTDITISNIKEIYKLFKFELIIPIHDFYWMSNELYFYTADIANSYLKENIIISNEIIELLLLADKIIMNSEFTYNIYKKYFDASNFIISYPNDYKVQNNIINIPEIKNNCINIGVFHRLSEYKGEEYINYLKEKFQSSSIKFIIVGANIPLYIEEQFYEYIRKYNINGFLLLNKWGETYSYLLTKIKKSGLPLLYNNFGAVKERLDFTQEHYFKVYDNEVLDDIEPYYTVLDSEFNKFIEYINENNGKTQEMNEDFTIITTPVYDDLFINKNYTLQQRSMINIINKEENTILIYTGFTNILWNDTYLQNNSLGGSEKAVAYLAKELSKKYNIIISGDVKDEIVNNVHYVNASKLQLLLNSHMFHTIIISRFLCFFEDYPFYSCKNLYICSHDSHGLINRVWNNSDKDRYNINNILIKYNKNITGVIALTEWHKNKLSRIYPSIKNKIRIINNGIQINDFNYNNNKIPNKFIWSSCSNRGLSIILNKWNDILNVIPDATLEICSYHHFPSSNEDFKMNKIIQANNSITHHGNLNTKDLYHLISRCEYWLYTNTIEESSCITALEMLMSNVICLYYPVAGLVDTIDDYGIKVEKGNEIDAILNLSEEKKDKLRKKGKEYALTCSWENRAKEWSSLLGLNKKIWTFYCSPHFETKMIQQYIDNLNYVYPEHNIHLTNDKNRILTENPSKITFVYEIFDTEIIKSLPNTQFSFLNTEPLNIPVRLEPIINILKLYPNLEYYDYSKSNLKILEENGFNIQDKIYLPYNCSDNELKKLINLNKKTKKEFDFGILKDSGGGIVDRRLKIIDFLKENNFTVNIIEGWNDDREIELAKCNTILNIHGFYQIPSHIFEHIRCNRLLEAGFTILSETNYKLDEEFVNKYPNLKQLEYNDFFNINIINKVCVNKKNICFIHSCHLKNKGLKRLEYLIDKIKTTGLIEYLEYIYIINIGIPIEENIYGDKFKICNYSDNPALYEIPTINKIHQFSKENTKCNILYLHTKGISFDDNNQNENDWIDMMLYFLVEKFDLCIEKMNCGIQAVGCNYYDENMIIRTPKCFGGNFWWSDSQYISELPSLIEKTENINPTDAEFWLCQNNPSLYEPHNSKINHYWDVYPEHKYKQIKIRDYRYDICNKGQSSGLDLNKYVKKCIDNIGSSNITNICDIGCGMGEHSKLLLSQYPTFKFTGIDWSQITIDYLKQKTSFFNEIIHCKSSNLPFNNKQFSIALCMENLEHLYSNDSIDAFKELKRISDYVIITIPRPEYIVNSHWLNKEISEASNDNIPLSFKDYISLESCVHKTGYYENSLIHAGFKKCDIEHPFNGIYYCNSNSLDISKIRYTGIDSNDLLQTSNYKEKYIDLLHKSLNLKFIQNQQKIIDCFIFYNELDLLTYRLNILNDVVDYFVLVESRHTFVGKEKSLFYNENKQLFEKFNHKIIHIIVDDFPYKYPNINIEKDEQWINERYQRDCISRGLDKLSLQSNDVITITDLDEISNPKILQQIKNKDIVVDINILELDFYYYNLNSKMDHQWQFSKILTFQKYKELGLSCEQIRQNMSFKIIENGGWHLSYFGDEKFIKNKIQNFGHQEYNSDNFTDENNIKERIINQTDLYDRPTSIINIPIEDNDNLPPEYDIYLKKFYKTQLTQTNKNIAFFIRHFTERGTEVSVYDYAHYNEKILGNNSYIIYFSDEAQKKYGFPDIKVSFPKFNSRFEMIEINDIPDMKLVIEKYKLDFFYTLTCGCADIYHFNNNNIWGNCKTIKHCVFDTTCNEGDYYLSISNHLNQKYETNIPLIPHIVDLPNTDKHLRNELNLPLDAIVLGRYGGFGQFDLDIAHNAILEFLNSNFNSNIYFLFMNTNKFFEHPKIIYLDKNIDLFYKTKFINTCDAMIHARSDGETFGLSIAEFSIKNKPIITCPCGDLEHILLLGDKALTYKDKDSLINIFNNIKQLINKYDDWNCYKEFTPEKVMNLFNNIVFDNKRCIGNLKTIIISHNNFMIECFENDDMANNIVKKNIQWEPHITKFIEIYNNRYDINNIIDVGANFGYHSLLFSKYVKNNVYSFEPQSQNYDLLTNNIKYNNISNIITYNNACGDNIENINMEIIDTTTNINMGDFTPNYINSNNYNTIKSILLDSIDFPKIDIIKIDVQGWEIKVLNGAKIMIEKYKPILIIEMENHQLAKTSSTCQQLIHIIREMGYYIYYLDYEYPSDHICVHSDNLDIFKKHFSNYIFEHTKNNNINNNVDYDIDKKISVI